MMGTRGLRLGGDNLYYLNVLLGGCPRLPTCLGLGLGEVIPRVGVMRSPKSRGMPPPRDWVGLAEY
jgi:hypothetical protein